MIDTISLWIGRIIIGTILILWLSIAWYYIIKNIFSRRIEFKALGYAIISNMKMHKHNKLMKKVDMRVGRKWYVSYKGKSYLWECIEEDK